jgi:predicted DNA-binding WGR domain protein
MPHLYRKLLRCVDVSKNVDKCYFIGVVPTIEHVGGVPSEIYAVHTAFGRTGSVPKDNLRTLRIDLDDAIKHAESVCLEKMKRGYVPTQLVSKLTVWWTLSEVPLNPPIKSVSHFMRRRKAEWDF